MGRDLPPGCSEKPRIGLNGGMNPENLRRRDPKSRELLGPLFGQVAVATVRNVLYNGVATLQNADKMLAGKVAQLRERKEQLQLMKNEDGNLLDQRDETGRDCSVQPEVRILASAGTVLYGSARGFLLTACKATQRGRQIDPIVKRAHCASAAMAGRGGKKGSFGGIGTGASFGGAESSGVPEGGYSVSGSTSRQQDYPQPAASRERSSHVGSVAQGSGRGDHVGKVEHESENTTGSGNSPRRPSGARGEHRGGRGGRGGKGAMDPIDALGRCMTAILRHRASDYDLEMKNDGFVLVADLLSLSKKTGAGIALSSHSEEDVRKVVAADGKQRFGLKEESGKLYIRANQGHSIKTVESGQLLSLITSPSQIPVCVHGTYDKFMSNIWQEGLKRMTRNHVHFATGLPKEDGVISGMRATAQVLIYLNVEKAMEDGMQLYISANNVVLTDGFDGVVPMKYFKKVVKKLPHGREITLFPPSHQPHQPHEPIASATADAQTQL